MMININGRQLEGRVETRMADTAWDGRESKAIIATMSYPEAIELFVNDAPWSVASEAVDDDGNLSQVTVDMSDYAISGPITDNRDGTVTVRMGKYRESELMLIPLAEAPANHAQARLWRGIIESAVQSIERDEDALAVRALYPAWETLIGTEAAAGERFRYNGALYRVMNAHTYAEEWIPGADTASLYARIDEIHAGTQGDPIPYDGNMALTSGLYYVQGGRVYLCIRDTVNPVYAALAELAGLYVEAVA